MSAAELKINRLAVEAREIDGELVIYDLASRRYLGGNRAVTVLWPLLLEGTDLDALATALVAEFGIGADRARTDAGALVDSLRTQGLLVEPTE